MGLAASHISLVSEVDLSSRGLNHRFLAVEGFNKAFAAEPKTKEEVDALLAACYSLSIQSVYIGESVAELFLMLRGCHIIFTQGWPQTIGTSFQNLEPYYQLSGAFDAQAVLPVLDPRRYIPGLESLERLRPLCTGAVEKKVLDWFIEVVQLLGISSREGK